MTSIDHSQAAVPKNYPISKESTFVFSYLPSNVITRNLFCPDVWFPNLSVVQRNYIQFLWPSQGEYQIFLNQVYILLLFVVDTAIFVLRATEYSHLFFCWVYWIFTSFWYQFVFSSYFPLSICMERKICFYLSSSMIRLEIYMLFYSLLFIVLDGKYGSIGGSYDIFYWLS